MYNIGLLRGNIMNNRNAKHQEYIDKLSKKQTIRHILIGFYVVVIIMDLILLLQAKKNRVILYAVLIIAIIGIIRKKTPKSRWKHIAGPNIPNMDQGYQQQIEKKLIPQLNDDRFYFPLKPLIIKPGILKWHGRDDNENKIILSFYNAKEDIENDNNYNMPMQVKLEYYIGSYVIFDTQIGEIDLSNDTNVENAINSIKEVLYKYYNLLFVSIVKRIKESDTKLFLMGELSETTIHNLDEIKKDKRFGYVGHDDYNEKGKLKLYLYPKEKNSLKIVFNYYYEGFKNDCEVEVADTTNSEEINRVVDDIMLCVKKSRDTLASKYGIKEESRGGE